MWMGSSIQNNFAKLIVHSIYLEVEHPKIVEAFMMEDVMSY